jgi:hypothetical protein
MMIRYISIAAAAFSVILGMGNGDANANPAPTQIDLLQSNWYARASGDALGDGDRVRAILLALRGIPADPTEADLEPYADAFGALWRGAASFSFQTDMSTLHVAFFSRSGHRALLLPAGEGLGAMSGEDVRLIAPSDGELVATLRSLDGTYPFFFQGFDQSVSAFSPDERLVAVSVVERGVGDYGFSGSIEIFDATTGAVIQSLPAENYHGFSGDSSHILIGNMFDGSLRMYDTQTWQQVGEPFGFAGVTSPFPGSDGAFYVLENTTSDYGSENGGLFLHRLAPDGAVRIADLTDLAAQGEPGVPQPVASETTPFFALATPTGELAIVGLDGRISARVPARAASAYQMAFVRGGQAVAVSAPFEGSGVTHTDLQVIGLDGATLEPMLQDTAPFLDEVATPDGFRIAFSSGPRVYEAPEWPTGLELYSRVWTEIPDALKERIDAERISRSEP